MDVADDDGKSLKAECFTLDVGQGACTILYIGDGRAVIIDTGPPSSTVPMQFLRRYVKTIDALIISHNHDDHDGSVTTILQMYPKAIRRIYFLRDGPAGLNKTYRHTKRQWQAGQLLNEPERLESAETPRVLFPRPDDPKPPDRAEGVSLRLYYPTMMDTLDAEAEEASPSRLSNRTSAILGLHCGERTLVLPGDASIEAWRKLHKRVGRRMLADVLVVPHHAGGVSTPTRDEAANRELYETILTPKVGIISVGTANTYKHPKPHAVASLRAAGATVVCTQMTRQCCSQLEDVRPGLITPYSPAQSSPVKSETGSGKPKDVACFGTVVIGINPDEFVIDRLDEHQQKVEGLTAAGYLPLCRPRP